MADVFTLTINLSIAMCMALYCFGVLNEFALARLTITGSSTYWLIYLAGFGGHWLVLPIHTGIIYLAHKYLSTMDRPGWWEGQHETIESQEGN